MDARPLILTARFDAGLSQSLNLLRTMHFPKPLNFLSAHLTLFHALPGASLESIQRYLQAQKPIESIECILPSLAFTGRGVQAKVDCDPLCVIRNTLADHWRACLSRQDQQLFRPHVTIQNKADPAQARQLFEQLSSTWTPLTGQIIALDLWHYAGGPWEPAGQFHLF